MDSEGLPSTVLLAIYHFRTKTMFGRKRPEELQHIDTCLKKYHAFTQKFEYFFFGIFRDIMMLSRLAWCKRGSSMCSQVDFDFIGFDSQQFSIMRAGVVSLSCVFSQSDVHTYEFKGEQYEYINEMVWSDSAWMANLRSSSIIKEMMQAGADFSELYRKDPNQAKALAHMEQENLLFNLAIATYVSAHIAKLQSDHMFHWLEVFSHLNHSGNLQTFKKLTGTKFIYDPSLGYLNRLISDESFMMPVNKQGKKSTTPVLYIQSPMQKPSSTKMDADQLERVRKTLFQDESLEKKQEAFQHKKQGSVSRFFFSGKEKIEKTTELKPRKAFIFTPLSLLICIRVATEYRLKLCVQLFGHCTNYIKNKKRSSNKGGITRQLLNLVKFELTLINEMLNSKLPPMSELQQEIQRRNIKQAKRRLSLKLGTRPEFAQLKKANIFQDRLEELKEEDLPEGMVAPPTSPFSNSRRVRRRSSSVLRRRSLGGLHNMLKKKRQSLSTHSEGGIARIAGGYDSESFPTFMKSPDEAHSLTKIEE